MTIYIHQTDGVIDTAVGPLPVSWRNISNLPNLSNSVLKGHGWLPVVDSGTASAFTEGATGASMGDVVPGGASDVTRTHTLKSIEDCKTIKIDQINVLRDAKRYPGNVSSGHGWDVDMRNAEDEKNISAVTLLAVSYKADGLSTNIDFTGADNVKRSLTPDQIVSMGRTVSAYVAGVYEQSRVHKSAVNALSGVQAVVDYDIHAGW